MWEFLKGVGALVMILGIILAVCIIAWTLSWIVRILGFVAGLVFVFALFIFALWEWAKECARKDKK